VGQRVLSHLQADIDSAFRRVPVNAQDRWACGVVFKVGREVQFGLLGIFLAICICFARCKVFYSRHAACPFGAVGSVHSWERVGAGICCIARKFLKVTLLRYVDDLFGPER